MRPELEQRIARGGLEAAWARLHLGLLAHAAEDLDLARRLLGEGPGPEALEDWRLLVLADCAVARGRTAEALDWLGRLEPARSSSPLVPTALRRRIELLAGARDLEPVRLLLGAYREIETSPERRSEVESLVWRLARELGHPALELEAARHLLVLDPMAASKLRVVDRFPMLGVPNWLDWLTPAEREERASSLLRAGLAESALATLVVTAAPERTFRWRILEARALGASGQALEALRRLAAARPATAEERFDLEWERAQLLEEVAAVRPGKTPLPSGERERLRSSARQHLLAAARLDPKSSRGREAFRRLAAEALAEERVDEALAFLRDLVEHHPGDTFGAGVLWERGWREFQARNASGAIGYWAELLALYPASSYARSARYWSARAQEQLGRQERARELYRELARARYADFYARQARIRLAGGTLEEPGAGPSESRETWPTDGLLERARWLSDAGLDGLAATELEAVSGGVLEVRAARALQALIASRQGEWRTSLRLLRQAFPLLGTALQDRHPELAVELYYPLAFRDAVVQAARREGLPPAMVFGIVHQESGFDPRAKSRSGALGLMQVMPATGREVAKQLGLPFAVGRLTEPDYSLRLGTHYFRRMLGLFWGREELALASYNGGPGRISRLWKAAGPEPELDRFVEGLEIEETRNYVKRILVLSDSYRRRHPGLA